MVKLASRLKGQQRPHWKPGNSTGLPLSAHCVIHATDSAQLHLLEKVLALGLQVGKMLLEEFGDL